MPGLGQGWALRRPKATVASIAAANGFTFVVDSFALAGGGGVGNFTYSVFVELCVVVVVVACVVYRACVCARVCVCACGGGQAHGRVWMCVRVCARVRVRVDFTFACHARRLVCMLSPFLCACAARACFLCLLRAFVVCQLQLHELSLRGRRDHQRHDVRAVRHHGR